MVDDPFPLSPPDKRFSRSPRRHLTNNNSNNNNNDTQPRLNDSHNDIPSSFQYSRTGGSNNFGGGGGFAITTPSSAKSRRSQELARQRWKILCLVKTADSATDEMTRQERLKERVDDWLTGFIANLRLEEEKKRKAAVAAAEEKRRLRKGSDGIDSGLADLSSGLDVDATTATTSVTSEVQRVLTDAKSEIRRSRTKERRRLESEQKKRIRRREREERERERSLVLEGKLEVTRDHLRDPVIRVHHNLLSVDQRVLFGGHYAGSASSKSVSPVRPAAAAAARDYGRTQQKPLIGKLQPLNSPRSPLPPPSPRAKSKSPRPKRKVSSRSRKARSTKTKDVMKVKWKNGQQRLTPQVGKEGSLDLLDLHTMVEDCTETVIANLVYDEQMDELQNSSPRLAAADSAYHSSAGGAEPASDANPVFHAFEQAKGVDDLYRIAEIWVNPAQLLQHKTERAEDDDEEDDQEKPVDIC